MLKFLRKYQKIMLVVFCVGLMFVFLVPQALQQFSPDAKKLTRATIYGSQDLSWADRDQAGRAIETMSRRLGDGMPMVDESIFPLEEDTNDRALAWLLIQRAAEHNGIDASNEEAFNLLATRFGVNDMDALDAAAEEFNESNAATLMELAKQYLRAEAYRQLVCGVEFVTPASDEQETASPGLRRFYTRFGQGTPLNGLAQLPAGEGAAIVFGSDRVTLGQLQAFMQKQFSEVELTIVGLDAAARIAPDKLTEEDKQAHFDRFKDDPPNADNPYGIGYQVPGQVKIEAIRIPVKNLYAKMYEDIAAEDVEQFVTQFPGVAQGLPYDPTGDYAAIEQAIAHQRAKVLAYEIGEKAAELMDGPEDDTESEDKTESDFAQPPSNPRSLGEAMTELAQLPAYKDYAIDYAPVKIEVFMNAQEIQEKGGFANVLLDTLPAATLQARTIGQNFQTRQFSVMLQEQKVYEDGLSGQVGLMSASAVGLLSDPGNPKDKIPFQAFQPRPLPLADLIRDAAAFYEAGSDEAKTGLATMKAGPVLMDATGNVYVFRITEVDPPHAPEDWASLEPEFSENAARVKAYEALVNEKDDLIKRAIDSKSVDAIMIDGDTKRAEPGPTDDKLTRKSQPGFASDPVYGPAFQIAEKLLLSGGTLKDEADRYFIIEKPGDFTVQLVRVDASKSITRDKFIDEALKPRVLQSAMGDLQEDPMSLAALMRYTEFEWEDGYEPGGDKSDAQETQE